MYFARLALFIILASLIFTVDWRAFHWVRKIHVVSCKPKQNHRQGGLEAYALSKEIEAIGCRRISCRPAEWLAAAKNLLISDSILTFRRPNDTAAIIFLGISDAVPSQAAAALRLNSGPSAAVAHTRRRTVTPSFLISMLIGFY